MVTGKDSALEAAIVEGPVAIAVDAQKWQLYSGGVFSNCGTNLDHGVVAVGYDENTWIVRNSWGPSWGDNGFITLKKGSDSNTCGLFNNMVVPTLNNAPPGPPTPPGPTPGPSGKTHYGDPKNGCESDEQSVQVTGLSGDFCSPKCTGIFKTKCPTDVPKGTTVTPQCALKTTTGDKYCALICQPGSNDAGCPTGASCQAIQGTGLCTYPQ